ncbi:hypothetical protein ASJ78_04337 [Serratia marcescens]|nr:hypothetical protein ASJ78_04337 [Serratia marcescens]
MFVRTFQEMQTQSLSLLRQSFLMRYKSWFSFMSMTRDAEN